MLSVKRELSVRARQAQVWGFVGSLGNWASLMPGYLSHEEIDRDTSVWTMQMNLGPFTRPIVIDVQVLEWNEPSLVRFSLKGRFDPFEGRGTFSSAVEGGGTKIDLGFEVEGTGPMAKVISAMAAPVLTTVADQFTAALQQELDGQAAAAPSVGARAAAAAHESAWRRFWSRIRALFAGKEHAKR